MTISPVLTPWTGSIAIDDTSLFVRDSGGPGQPVVFLNGCYADMGHWRRVVAALDHEDFRAILFDERARGKSGTSADYSFDAGLRDVTAVLDARGVERPILAGWSYGAYLAVYYAHLHPDRVAGIVSVDGAMPFGLTGEAGQAQIRTLFKRLSWLFPVGARLGLAARMTASQHAEVNIESNEKGARCAPVLATLRCPVRYVLGTGGHLGASASVMEEGRATLAPLMETNPQLKLAAKVPSNHSKILSRDWAAVADAVREVAAAMSPE